MKDKLTTCKLTIEVERKQEMKYHDLTMGDIFTWGYGCDYAIKCLKGHVMLNGGTSGDIMEPMTEITPVTIAKNPRLVVEE